MATTVGVHTGGGPGHHAKAGPAAAADGRAQVHTRPLFGPGCAPVDRRRRWARQRAARRRRQRMQCHPLLPHASGSHGGLRTRSLALPCPATRHGCNMHAALRLPRAPTSPGAARARLMQGGGGRWAGGGRAVGVTTKSHGARRECTGSVVPAPTSQQATAHFGFAGRQTRCVGGRRARTRRQAQRARCSRQQCQASGLRRPHRHPASPAPLLADYSIVRR